MAERTEFVATTFFTLTMPDGRRREYHPGERIYIDPSPSPIELLRTKYADCVKEVKPDEDAAVEVPTATQAVVDAGYTQTSTPRRIATDISGPSAGPYDKRVTVSGPDPGPDRRTAKTRGPS